MGFFDKISDMAKDAADKTSDMIEVQKLNSKISDENNKMVKTINQLGEYYWKQFKEGAVLDSEATEMCNLIAQSEEQIANIKEEIKSIKAEGENKEKHQESSDYTTCPSCGSQVPSGKKFCPECGHDMIQEESKVEDKTVENIKCPSCGADVEHGKKFCPECGQKLDQ